MEWNLILETLQTNIFDIIGNIGIVLAVVFGKTKTAEQLEEIKKAKLEKERAKRSKQLSKLQKQTAKIESMEANINA